MRCRITNVILNIQNLIKIFKIRYLKNNHIKKFKEKNAQSSS